MIASASRSVFIRITLLVTMELIRVTALTLNMVIDLAGQFVI